MPNFRTESVRTKDYFAPPAISAENKRELPEKRKIAHTCVGCGKTNCKPELVLTPEGRLRLCKECRKSS